MKKTWIAWSVAILVVGIIVAYNYIARDRAAGDQASANSSAGQPAASQAPPKEAFNAGYPLKDTSMLKPPAGAKVAIFEFEDLECPACAHAFPIVHATATEYRVPLVRHDYPWSFHIWSFDAAVTARYIQDNISPQLADDFRRDVFAGQQRIASKDDLVTYTRAWFKSHGKTLPFVMDASGACRNEVEADHALGDRLGVASTPCIIVVTPTGFVPVAYSDIDQLGRIVHDALTQTGGPAASSLAIPARPVARAAIPRFAPARS
ncbi:MAG: thioredoxin domain-containing protein [Acidobacteriaceae bacterium]|jgi:protein-disulfide isomerase